MYRGALNLSSIGGVVGGGRREPLCPVITTHPECRARLSTTQFLLSGFFFFFFFFFLLLHNLSCESLPGCTKSLLALCKNMLTVFGLSSASAPPTVMHYPAAASRSDTPRQESFWATPLRAAGRLAVWFAPLRTGPTEKTAYLFIRSFIQLFIFIGNSSQSKLNPPPQKNIPPGSPETGYLAPCL